MVYQLRPYQFRDVGRIREEFQTHNNVLYQLATGGGKTVVFSHIVHGIDKANRSVTILVHRQELVAQCSMSLAENGLMHRIIAPSHVSRDCMRDQIRRFGKGYIHPATDVVVASVQTLVKNFNKLPPPDWIIGDEAHHFTPKSTWGKILNQYPKARVLGVTATPERLDGKGMANCFDTLVCGPTMQELIDQNFLCVPKCYSHPPGVDLNMKTQFGDYKKSESEEKMSGRKVVGDAVEHYGDLCRGVPAVAFCVTVKHAEIVAEKFCQAGFRAIALDGKTDKQIRKGALDALGRGDLDVVTSCELISEGVDVPLAAAAILLRPTQSLSLYLQQVGRVLRRYPVDSPIMKRPNMAALMDGDTHYAYIIDHAGNIGKHGLPQANREWILTEDKVKRPKAAIGEKDCPKCEFVHIAALDACPSCGHSYVKETRNYRGGTAEELPLEIDGTLIEFADKPHWAGGLSLQKAPLKKLLGLAHAETHFKQIAAARGYKPGWVYFRMKERYGDNA